LRNAFISGTGSYTPPDVVTNDDLRTRFGIDTSHEWILQRTGIEARRFSAAGVATSDLGLEAAKRALENANLAPQDLDLILFATLSPDHAFPGCGVYLQEKLGLCDGANAKFVPAMDVRNQCSGFLYSLATAHAFVRSGAAKHVLVVGAETHSPMLDLSTRGRGVATLFGDGAGAVIVSRTEENRGIGEISLGADGRYADVLSQKVWDIKKRPFIDVDADGNGRIEPEQLWPQMQGPLVFKHAVERMKQVMNDVLAAQKWESTEVDLFFFHQANLRINQYVQEVFAIPNEKVISNIQRFGNTSAATLPLLLDEANRSGRLKRGMKLAFAAFGSGFTWGGATMTW
jgi:3-oxoacyl-[acyl-carrier-protein] synthase-3